MDLETKKLIDNGTIIWGRIGLSATIGNPKEVPVFEKYDEYIPEELIRKGFAYGVLDIEQMKKRVSGWKNE